MKIIFKKALLFLAAAAVLAAFAFWSETGRRALHKGLAPVLWISSKVSFHPIRSTRACFTTRHALRHENKLLRREMDQLRQQLLSTREIEKENERLRDLLHFTTQVKYQTVPARVVGRDPTQWYRAVLIDKGSRDGLKIHMPVVNHEGLVGKIVDLSASMAQVQLIVDFSSRVGGMLQESREVGILSGKGTAGCRLLYISRNAKVAPGERVLTSGVGSLYPKGLLIGKVREVTLEKGGLYQKAQIDPDVDFGKLEEVLVLVSTE